MVEVQVLLSTNVSEIDKTRRTKTYQTCREMNRSVIHSAVIVLPIYKWRCARLESSKRRIEERLGSELYARLKLTLE